MERSLLYNARIVDNGETRKGWVVIEDDCIAEVGKGDPGTDTIDSCSTKTDFEGDMLIPGVIDDQVHFRDPGMTHKGDIETESRAAIAGGVTSYMDMPNTLPPTVTLEALSDKMNHAAETSRANYSFFIGGTNDNIEILKSIDYSEVCGVKLFLGSSTGNMLVDNNATIERIFSEVPALIAIHSEDEEIIRRNRTMYSAKYGEELPPAYHPLIRSEEACYKSTKRAVELARRFNTRLNVLHLSTARELSLFRRGVASEKRITAEVCVHHLMYDDSYYTALGNRIKCNPAIKTGFDRERLREALCDDVIDIVATDHAPHLLSEKVGNCLTAASGLPSVQYSLVAMFAMANEGIFTPELVVKKMCNAPADVYRIKNRGYIRKGYYADLVRITSQHPTKVTQENILSRCGWSPFEGISFPHSVVTTWLNGKIAYNKGVIDDSIRGKKLTFDITQ